MAETSVWSLFSQKRVAYSRVSIWSLFSQKGSRTITYLVWIWVRVLVVPQQVLMSGRSQRSSMTVMVPTLTRPTPPDSSKAPSVAAV